MSNNWTYECPLTGKTFAFSQHDKASMREALAAQQVHTAAEMQRLERQAGRRLTYRETLHASWMERKAKEVEQKETPPEAPKPTDEPHPLARHIYQQAFGHLPVVS